MQLGIFSGSYRRYAHSILVVVVMESVRVPSYVPQLQVEIALKVKTGWHGASCSALAPSISSSRELSTDPKKTSLRRESSFNDSTVVLFTAWARGQPLSCRLLHKRVPTTRNRITRCHRYFSWARCQPATCRERSRKYYQHGI